MDIKYFKNKLCMLKKELIEELRISAETGSKDTVSLDQQNMGRLSRMDALQGQQMALEQDRRRERMLRGVQCALRRIDEDGYGYCSDCGESINPKRLEINPCADKCIKCAE
ncbi:RNA polymerase-binding transcription factor DksA [invertebrate metagenome]|uniref:RNA polymerase-binding transcription factor DksA n=1 Tax=invertebrate metagenome TaxID=1711999 RepID=A0A2H9T6E2_9ZZZZ